MIKAISLIGFKSFLHRILDLNQLTILTGLNSSGKSSIIQALLILEKAYKKENSILLEGHGTIEDIRNRYFKEQIVLSVADEHKRPFLVKLHYGNKDKDYSSIDYGEFIFPEIIYISANRFGPKTSIPLYTDSFKRGRIGSNGENLFQCIEELSDEVLNEKLWHEKSEGQTLKFNISGWLNVISPNIDFKYDINKISDSSYSTFDQHRAANVGFGLSYALPVISALLIGTIIPNSLVIIENPEAHLHPRGQTEIARLISLCIESGAQIIIETHSDHIIDGIRIAAKQTNGFADKVQIHWFELDKNKNTEVNSPILDNEGRLNEWPKGFFDQFEINSSKLI